MKIHVPTQTIFRDDSHRTAEKKAYLKYRELTGKAESVKTLDFTLYDIYPYVEPVVGADQRRTDNLVVVDGIYSYEVVDLTAQEISDRDVEALFQSRLAMSITPRQFRRGLLAYPGKLQQVEDYIALQSEEDKIDWLHGNSVDRLYPLTIAMIAELGFTEEQADQFFINSAQI